jgi:hypothetical protein
VNRLYWAHQELHALARCEHINSIPLVGGGSAGLLRRDGADEIAERRRPEYDVPSSGRAIAAFIRGLGRVALSCAISSDGFATVSATVAPRILIGFGSPVVEFWCSISALSSSPKITMITDIQVHIISPITAPREPSVALWSAKFLR